MTDDLTADELADATRDAIALVTANMHDPGDTLGVALAITKMHDGETVKHWIMRTARTLDMTAYIAASWLREWANTTVVPPETLLRYWAEGWNSRVSGNDN